MDCFHRARQRSQLRRQQQHSPEGHIMNPPDATIAEIQMQLTEIEAAAKRLNECLNQSREYNALIDGIIQAVENPRQLDRAAFEQFHRLLETYKSIGGLLEKAPFTGGGAKEIRLKVARAIFRRRWPKFLGSVRFHD